MTQEHIFKKSHILPKIMQKLEIELMKIDLVQRAPSWREKKLNSLAFDIMVIVNFTRTYQWNLTSGSRGREEVERLFPRERSSTAPKYKRNNKNNNKIVDNELARITVTSSVLKSWLDSCCVLPKDSKCRTSNHREYWDGWNFSILNKRFRVQVLKMERRGVNFWISSLLSLAQIPISLACGLGISDS